MQQTRSSTVQRTAATITSTIHAVTTKMMSVLRRNSLVHASIGSGLTNSAVRVVISVLKITRKTWTDSLSSSLSVFLHHDLKSMSFSVFKWTDLLIAGDMQLKILCRELRWALTPFRMMAEDLVSVAGSSPNHHLQLLNTNCKTLVDVQEMYLDLFWSC